MLLCTECITSIYELTIINSPLDELAFRGKWWQMVLWPCEFRFEDGWETKHRPADLAVFPSSRVPRVLLPCNTHLSCRCVRDWSISLRSTPSLCRICFENPKVQLKRRTSKMIIFESIREHGRIWLVLDKRNYKVASLVIWQSHLPFPLLQEFSVRFAQDLWPWRYGWDSKVKSEPL